MGVLHHGVVVEVTTSGVMVSVPTMSDLDVFGPCIVYGSEVFVGDTVLVGQMEDTYEDLVVVAGLEHFAFDFVDSATIDFTKTVVDDTTTVTAIVKANSIPLTDLSDVTITTPASGELVRYNGSLWVNARALLDDLSDVIITSAATGQVLKYNGTNWVNVALTFDELSDVIISSPATAQVIRYNGTNWVNAALTLDDLSDVVITSAAAGHVLQHNGTNWVNQSTLDMVGSSGADSITTKVTGDSNKRLVLNAEGKIEWGTGSATPDVNLYRFGTDQLASDDEIHSVRTAGQVAFAAHASGDSQPKFRILGDGQQEWGDGSSAVDTNLYRSAANTLKTDDSLTVVGTLRGNTDVQFNGTTMGRGLYKRALRSAAKGSIGATELGALRLNCTLLANRSYLVYSEGSMNSSVNEQAQVRVRIRADYAGSNASTSSAIWGDWEGLTQAGSGTGSYICSFVYMVGGSDVSASFLLTGVRVVGTGTFTLSGLAAAPEIFVIDLGPIPSNDGTDI